MSREGKTDSARFLERQETPFQNRIFLPKVTSGFVYICYARFKLLSISPRSQMTQLPALLAQSPEHNSSNSSYNNSRRRRRRQNPPRRKRRRRRRRQSNTSTPTRKKSENPNPQSKNPSTFFTTRETTTRSGEQKKMPSQKVVIPAKLLNYMPDCSKSPTTFVNLRKILGDLGYEETTDLEANFTLFWTWNQAIKKNFQARVLNYFIPCSRSGTATRR